MVSLSFVWFLLDASWALLGLLLASLGRFLGPFGRILEPSWAHLGSLLASWAHLGPLVASLSSSWRLLDASWSRLGSLLVSLRRLWAPPQPPLASLGRFLRGTGPVSGCCRARSSGFVETKRSLFLKTIVSSRRHGHFLCGKVICWSRVVHVLHRASHLSATLPCLYSSLWHLRCAYTLSAVRRQTLRYRGRRLADSEKAVTGANAHTEILRF